MKKGYMIQDYKGGFWSEDYGAFKGVAFATFYTEKEAAEEEIKRILNLDSLQKTHGNTPMFTIDAYVKD